jgi:beta-fructofuranosidase
VLYRPPDPTLRLWDTWIYRDNDTVHLFHLQGREGDVGCTSIGHATTQDWVHWETLPPVLAQGHGTAWDAGPLMTGMVVRHEDRYYQFYGAMIDRVQRIGVAVSDDLVHWTKVGDSPILEAGGPWYETDPAQALNYETAWRDPYVFYHAPDDCYYATICARAAHHGDTGGGCIAVARSENLLDWSLLPPAYVSDAHVCLEVPEYFALGGKHYLTYTTSYHFGIPYPVNDPYQAAGSFYVVSDDALSGYEAPKDSSRLNTSMPFGTKNYVGRSVPDPEDDTRRIFYYQHVLPSAPQDPPQGALSAIKYLKADDGGELALHYAPILDPFADDAQPVDRPVEPDCALALLAEDAPEGIFEATVSVPYAGICFRMATPAGGLPSGLAVWLAPRRERDPDLVLMMGGIRFPPGLTGNRPYFGNPLAMAQIERGAGFPYRLRVVCRGPFIDVYVDDRLSVSYTFDPADLPAGQGAGAFYAGCPKAGAVETITVRRINP